MATVGTAVESKGLARNRGYWLRGALIFLALVVVARFVLEVAGVSHQTTRYVSSSLAIFLVALYLGAVAPLRGLRRFLQLIIPAIVLGAWTSGWIIVFTLASGVLRLERSHFSEPAEYGNWSRLGQRLLGHVIAIPVLALFVLIVMAVPFILRRWPITVGPAAILGGLVVVRYWVEAMGVTPTVATAWSSTVGALVCGFYLGGMSHRYGLESGRQLFAPALLIGWTWRFWVFLAAVVAAVAPFKTHFFDPSRGHIAVRLWWMLVSSVVEGFVAGLIVWGIAVWIARGTRPATP